jgi:protein-S-isoprenylcysteine O-methyltransferase Ste14
LSNWLALGSLPGWLIFTLWLTLVVYWTLSARAVMHRIGKWIWWREIALRLGSFALVVLVLQSTVAGHGWSNSRPDAPGVSMLMGFAGVAPCALGIGLAILGRASLGQNWAMPRPNNTSSSLVTTGAYAYIRHPIYGGMILAMLGSAIGQSLLWLLPLFVYGPHFLLSARREEKLLLEQFPQRYPAYMKRTRMLLPFVL